MGNKVRCLASERPKQWDLIPSPVKFACSSSTHLSPYPFLHDFVTLFFLNRPTVSYASKSGANADEVHRGILVRLRTTLTQQEETTSISAYPELLQFSTIFEHHMWRSWRSWRHCGHPVVGNLARTNWALLGEVMRLDSLVSGWSSPLECSGHKLARVEFFYGERNWCS